jgi:hypothetical protein
MVKKKNEKVPLFISGSIYFQVGRLCGHVGIKDGLVWVLY